MGVSRSGYYKWRKRDKSTRDLRREEVIALVSEVHKAHPSHGYRWVAAFIRVNYQQDISDNYVYKAFRFLGIKAKTKHQVHYRPRKIRDLYPNLIFTTWDTVDRPRQVIVSDMTVLKPWIFYLELTLYFDVFTKQILTWKLSERRGGREQYLDGLADVVELLRGKKEPTIIHTDQGSVYSSKAYNELIQDCNVVRSMSRAGKPTDNPVNEALNGWIKEELFIDFRLEECRTRDAVKDVLCRYVAFYNRQRPCFAIGYDTPDNYCKRFYRGELEKKDTFSKRILTEEEMSDLSDKLNHQYIDLLNGDGLASDKFWELNRRIREDRKSLGVQMELRKPDLPYTLVNLLHEKIITEDDLNQFSNVLQDAVKQLQERIEE